MPLMFYWSIPLPPPSPMIDYVNTVSIFFIGDDRTCTIYSEFKWKKKKKHSVSSIHKDFHLRKETFCCKKKKKKKKKYK